MGHCRKGAGLGRGKKEGSKHLQRFLSRRPRAIVPPKRCRMINARSETAGTKPAFRDALQFRRCLIPADGFYEWRKMGKTKQPYCFEVGPGELFAFAGIWDR
jgi:putative SOS response-associated peptidase YedK